MAHDDLFSSSADVQSGSRDGAIDLGTVLRVTVWVGSHVE